jgi:hypothetical protein
MFFAENVLKVAVSKNLLFVMNKRKLVSTFLNEEPVNLLKKKNTPFIKSWKNTGKIKFETKPFSQK